MNDSTTTLHQLRQIVQEFVDERDWQQFHSPKNLTMALAIEAAELMEHFQWLTVEQSRAVRADEQQLAAIGEEMADVMCYLMATANALDLDLSAAVKEKMVKNRLKYPADEYRGRFGPSDPKP
ncbi:MAG: nucleotide pyrophosphohydrolase [Planctomycetaceae bacterium]|nr:nucleotide pyrophosphohydrolase [Planctomycetaceae bacterium]